jgi:predicted unusual protein kinase regulating ubiquinone biosynthesis (AarF/ABC1/UbiB family)
MEFIDGIKITDVAGLRSAGLDTNQVARRLAEAYCEQILGHGFFHADPHPGNILVQRRPDGAPRLVLLDFGLAKDLPPRFRDGVVAFTAALVQGRSQDMAQALVDLGFETRRGGPERSTRSGLRAGVRRPPAAC